MWVVSQGSFFHIDNQLVQLTEGFPFSLTAVGTFTENPLTKWTWIHFWTLFCSTDLLLYLYANMLGDSEGQRSPACCSPWGRKESNNSFVVDWITTMPISSQCLDFEFNIIIVIILLNKLNHFRFYSKTCAVVIYWTSSLLVDIQNTSNFHLLQLWLYCMSFLICVSMKDRHLEWAQLGGRSLFWSRLQTAFPKMVRSRGMVHPRPYTAPFQVNLRCLVPLECYLMSCFCALSWRRTIWESRICLF